MGKLSDNELIYKASNIHYFFTDVDGSLTDGSTFYSKSGEVFKRFSMRDGTGFYLLQKAKIVAGLVTGENSQIAMQRSKKLRLKFCFLGVSNKLKMLQNFADENHILLDEIAYMGDDLNDSLLLGKVGLFFCPNDACKDIKQNADIVCNCNGGDGAFRWAVEKLLNLKGLKLMEVFNS